MQNSTPEGNGGQDAPEVRPEWLGAMTLYPVPESVSRARRWFRKFIARHELACSVDDCLLMVSELVTNAILYGQAEEEWRVRVEWWRQAGTLRVDVHNPGFPAGVRMRTPSADEAHGRGLRLVDELADSWHAGPSCYGGTVVSFALHKAWPASAEGRAFPAPGDAS